MRVSVFVLLCVVLCVGVFAYTVPPQTNFRPIIGIYTAPSQFEPYSSDNYSYILASYIKYVESAGAQAVPIPYDSSIQYLDILFSKINGILFPGGDVPFEEYDAKKDLFLSNAIYLIQKAKNATDNGDFFPVWGICQGFQLITYIESGIDRSILISGYKDYANHTLYNMNITSRLFSSMPIDLQTSLQQKPLVYYTHNWAIPSDAYFKNSNLEKSLRITSMSKTDIGAPFIASIESINYPIFGTQFHPEKVLFEWKVPVSHQFDSIQSSQYFLNFFGNLTRSNSHRFESVEEENQYLIYKYPVFSFNISSSTQTYIVPNYHAAIKKDLSVNQPTPFFQKLLKIMRGE